MATLTEAMVDRLFWRAGFGPLQSQREYWTGKTTGELVDWFLTTPNTYATTSTPPVTAGTTPNQPIVAINSEDELTMEWLYRMQRRSTRCRSAWRSSGTGTGPSAATMANVSTKYAVWYRDHLMRFADFQANPTLSFRTLAFEMTTQNAAMSVYLNLNQNTKSKPNENYAREIMELFCLGPTGPDGTENYLQTDVATLTRCFTGWTLQNNDDLDTYGTITANQNTFDINAKQFSAKFANQLIPAMTKDKAADCVAQAIDMVLAHDNHAQFLIRKLWAEFIASPIRRARWTTSLPPTAPAGFKLKLADPVDPRQPADLRVNRGAEPDQSATGVHRRAAPRSTRRSGGRARSKRRMNAMQKV